MVSGIALASLKVTGFGGGVEGLAVAISLRVSPVGEELSVLLKHVAQSFPRPALSVRYTVHVARLGCLWILGGAVDRVKGHCFGHCMWGEADFMRCFGRVTLSLS